MWDSMIEEYKVIGKKKSKRTELAQKFGLFGVSAGTHALLLSTQCQHVGNTVASVCSLTVAVASRQ